MTCDWSVFDLSPVWVRFNVKCKNVNVGYIFQTGQLVGYLTLYIHMIAFVYKFKPID